ncbi:conserved protein [Methanothermobacter thermautotrophicus str. Delta H]|uniref:Conserved protein n=1 Tax=Methanothermobacter thermautotrophicus (strain ATCC 29096 / DSM 1053 / JCM 10044 / NBRC 100330 / Delta H) TaxID=187420 RepID=O27589_METTH|nr:conserved protein [Methanothermobacter thermautotrophicus str. Delta H]
MARFSQILLQSWVSGVARGSMGSAHFMIIVIHFIWIGIRSDGPFPTVFISYRVYIGIGVAMIIKEAIRDIIHNLEKMERDIDERTLDNFIEILTSAANVFVLGLGRSGLVARAFAMRLMHLEINAFVVGETITPAINEGDVLIAISGSGRTSYIVNAASIARERGAKVVAVTSYPDSDLAGLADLTVTIKGRTKIDGEKDYMKRQMRGNHHSRTPLGTLFEISALVFLDGIIAELMERFDKREEDLHHRHSSFD